MSMKSGAPEDAARRNPVARRLQLALIATGALLAFAANSLLCRLALATTTIDPVTFTTVRIAAGAIVLWLIVRIRDGSRSIAGSWASAAALFAYAACFSYAYVGLTAATGALLLFGAVQATMLGYGVASGEQLRALQAVGLVAAIGGLVALLLPGVAAPSPLRAALMIAAGVAWGVYSLRGRGTSEATAATAGNFMRALPMALVLSLVMFAHARIDAMGAMYAVLSGAVASGLGYAIWYVALPRMAATTAATIQLGVPVIAALGGVILLDEQLTLRLVICALVILAGVALAITERARR